MDILFSIYIRIIYTSMVIFFNQLPNIYIKTIKPIQLVKHKNLQVIS